MRIHATPLLGVLLFLVGCGSQADIAPPPNAVGMEAPSDTPSRNGRIAGKWLSDASSMPKGAIRMEIMQDGTYRMKMVEARESLVETILSASAGSLTWDEDGFVHGEDEHPAPEMKRFGRWTAGFEGDAAKMVIAPLEGGTVVFERERGN